MCLLLRSRWLRGLLCLFFVGGLSLVSACEPQGLSPYPQGQMRGRGRPMKATPAQHRKSLEVFARKQMRIISLRIARWQARLPETNPAQQEKKRLLLKPIEEQRSIVDALIKKLPTLQDPEIPAFETQLRQAITTLQSRFNHAALSTRNEIAPLSRQPAFRKRGDGLTTPFRPSVFPPPRPPAPLPPIMPPESRPSPRVVAVTPEPRPSPRVVAVPPEPRPSPRTTAESRPSGLPTSLPSSTPLRSTLPSLQPPPSSLPSPPTSVPSRRF